MSKDEHVIALPPRGPCVSAPAYASDVLQFVAWIGVGEGKHVRCILAAPIRRAKVLPLSARDSSHLMRTKKISRRRGKLVRRTCGLRPRAQRQRPAKVIDCVG